MLHSICLKGQTRKYKETRNNRICFAFDTHASQAYIIYFVAAAAHSWPQPVQCSAFTM